MAKAKKKAKKWDAPPPWMRHRMNPSYVKGRWRCHHGSAEKTCGDCTWEHGYEMGLIDGGKIPMLSKQDRSAMLNIRMEIVDAIRHYSKPMHNRMVKLIDRIMGKS